MSRRKGELTPSRIDREYPHQVEIEVPHMGLGNHLNEMHDFCRERGFKVKGHGGRLIASDRVIDVSYWCFATPEAADAFWQAFGGVRLTRKPRH
jgi:hypothetical protein